jgi:hypothetical protein
MFISEMILFKNDPQFDALPYDLKTCNSSED